MAQATAIPIAPRRADDPDVSRRESEPPAPAACRAGLRAQGFRLLPEEDPEEWRALVEVVRAAYRPRDAAEALYVDAIAVAIWRERRADRLEAEAIADIPPVEEGRGCGSDLTSATARASLATILRYRRSAQLEHRRAVALLKEHRRLRTAPVERVAPDRETEVRTAATARKERPVDLAAGRSRIGAADAEPVAPPAEPTMARLPGSGSDDGLRALRTRAPDRLPEPGRVELRAAERARLNPLDTPVLRALGRDPNLVLPVPGVEPRFWPKAQERATSGPFPPEGPQPYRRVPGLPWEMWWNHQHLLRPRSAPIADPADRESRAA